MDWLFWGVVGGLIAGLAAVFHVLGKMSSRRDDDLP